LGWINSEARLSHANLNKIISETSAALRLKALSFKSSFIKVLLPQSSRNCRLRRILQSYQKVSVSGATEHWSNEEGRTRS
jgi:hypothetical protein